MEKDLFFSLPKFGQNISGSKHEQVLNLFASNFQSLAIKKKTSHSDGSALKIMLWCGRTGFWRKAQRNAKSYIVICR